MTTSTELNVNMMKDNTNITNKQSSKDNLINDDNANNNVNGNQDGAGVSNNGYLKQTQIDNDENRETTINEPLEHDSAEPSRAYYADFSKIESHCLKAPCFFKSHRRRSKTYSGEEFSAHLEKIATQSNTSANINDKNSSTNTATNNSSNLLTDNQSTSQEELKDLPGSSNANIGFTKKNDFNLSNRRFSLSLFFPSFFSSLFYIK